MRTYRDYCPEQQFLMPPALQDWLPEGHLALFLNDVVDELDLGEFHASYESADGRGQPPYHPAMMVKLLLYAYITGKPSSRKIEQATHTDVAFRILAANQHPDHDSVAEFRKRHLGALGRLFMQALQLCQKAGLVKLGHVALDGTKIKANASKHKAMSYERMCQTEQKLEEQVRELLKKAEQTDEEEDQRYGRGERGQDVPAELARRENRLKAIREAKAALEEQARERARQKALEAQAVIKEREREVRQSSEKAKGRMPEVVDPEQAVPEAKAQRNFTDPDSRIMRDGATKSFEQAYNAQAVVDGHAQIIVAADLTDEANDKRQLGPMLEQVEQNTGSKPKEASADSGYFSEAAVTNPALDGIELFIAVDRQKHGAEEQKAEGEAPEEATVKEKMQHKLNTEEGKAAYGQRKKTVEPVFGQIKEERGFRRFSFRGKEKVGQEWLVICLSHNLLKLFRSGKWKKSLVRSEGRMETRSQGAVALSTC